MLELNNQLGELEEELSKLKRARDLIDGTQEATKQVIDACETTRNTCAEVTKKAGNVLNHARDTLTRIEASNQSVNAQASQTLSTIQEIDFPAQFQTMNATISGINIGIQNILQICGTITSKTDAISTKMETENDKIREKMEQNHKRLEYDAKKWNTIQLCVTVLSAIGIIVVLLIR